jgi:hypothetical protein
VLSDLGIPEEVYIGGIIEPDVHWQSFDIALYYPDQGILALFGNGLQPIQYQSTLDLCFKEIFYVEINLWAPVNSFDESRDQIFGKTGLPFYRLEDATNMTIEEFYKAFTNPAVESCLKSPAEKWPGHQ